MGTKHPRYVYFVGLLILLSVSPFVVYAQGDDELTTLEYLVTAENANLRSGPGTGFGITGTVSAGDSLQIYDEIPETQGWLRIHRPGKDDAYIADFLVERAPMRYYPEDQAPVVILSGAGSQVTEVVELPQSAYRIDVVVQDNSFILESIVIEGECRDDHIFNELNFDVNRLVISGLLASRGCSFVFSTDNVNGEWTLEFRDILDPEYFEDSLVALDDEAVISGTGRTLTMATELPEGIWTLNATVHDQAFIMHAHVLDGDCDDTSVFNELDFDVDLLEASTVYRSPKDGCIIFWETSNVENDWEIVFKQLR